EREVSAVCELLRDPTVRLVTLLGPGGTGKTRLAIEVGGRLGDQFRDGVYFVPLAPISDPSLVVPAIAEALGLRDISGQSLEETLLAFLRDKQVLLVLDNFEQLVSAAPVVSDILSQTTRVKVLVTSRAVLRLSSEHEFPVPPLSVPDGEGASEWEKLAQYDAVRLFTQRARAATSAFALTEDNAVAVAEICKRVDGLPLAIELAAARVRLLSPQAMLTRFGDPLKLLTGGARDLPSRQQTIRNTIDWSYQLLTAQEQTLFSRLGAFTGGATLEAAEAVCAAKDGIDVLSGIESLVEKSLLRQEEGADGEPRFRMLQTVQEYALERLDASGDGVDVRRRHAGYFLALAEEAEPHLRSLRSVEWLERLESDTDNYRAALTWLFGRLGTEPEVSDTLQRLVAVLWRLWYIRSHWREGRLWLERVLSATPAGEGIHRAKALIGVGLISLFQGDYAPATEWLQESKGIYAGLGDHNGVAAALTDLGYIAAFQQDHARSLEIQSELNALRPQLTDQHVVAYMLIFMGLVAANEVDIDRSRVLHEESLALFRKLGDRQGICWCLTNLGLISIAMGDLPRAAVILRENLALARQVGDQQSGQYSFLGLATVSLLQGQPERAVRLWAAAEAARESTGLHLHPLVRSRTGYDESVAAAREQLGQATFETLWAEGRTMTPERATAFALESPPTRTEAPMSAGDAVGASSDQRGSQAAGE
ncbi:MAG: NB-ARC domain-containing protein, partial [Chloroflexota bacterium]|nr:NB-ARC domain-containing protein [Chloroflexota bacterium]